MNYWAEERFLTRGVPILFLVLFASLTALISLTNALDESGGKNAMPAQSSVAPSSGARAEFLNKLSYFDERYVSLAEVVPAEKYTWRPSMGIRSIGEVYAHIAVGNYKCALALGA